MARSSLDIVVAGDDGSDLALVRSSPDIVVVGGDGADLAPDVMLWWK